MRYTHAHPVIWIPSAIVLAAVAGAAAGVSGPLPLVAIAGVATLAAIFRYPKLSALVLLALTPFYDLVVVKIGPADIRLLEVGWAVVVLALLARAAVGKTDGLRPLPVWALGLAAAIVLWEAGTTLYSLLPVRSVIETMQTGYLLLVGLLVASVVSSLDVSERAAAIKGAAYSFMVAWSISVAFFLFSPRAVPRIIVSSAGMEVLQGEPKVQAAGAAGILLQRFNLLTIGNVESAVAFIAVLAIAVAVLLDKRAREHRGFAVVVAGMAAVGLVLTYSRAGWVVALIVIWLLGARLGIKRLAAVTAAMFGVVLLAMTHPAVAARAQELTNVREGSFAVHIRMWVTAIYMTTVHPFVGWGPGTFKEYAPLLGIGTEWWPWLSPQDAHNFVLQAAAETGIAGAVLILGFVAAVLAVSLAGALRTRSIVAFGLFTAAFGVILMDLTQNAFRTELTWVVLGLALVPWLDALAAKKTAQAVAEPALATAPRIRNTAEPSGA